MRLVICSDSSSALASLHNNDSVIRQDILLKREQTLQNSEDGHKSHFYMGSKAHWGDGK